MAHKKTHTLFPWKQDMILLDKGCLMLYIYTIHINIINRSSKKLISLSIIQNQFISVYIQTIKILLLLLPFVSKWNVWRILFSKVFGVWVKKKYFDVAVIRTLHLFFLLADHFFLFSLPLWVLANIYSVTRSCFLMFLWCHFVKLNLWMILFSFLTVLVLMFFSELESNWLFQAQTSQIDPTNQ